MTDNEIVKALECCTSRNCSDNEESTRDCPLKNDEYCACTLPQYALDLINRQKAEAESLKDIIVKSNRDMFSSVAIMIEENRERIRFEKIRYLEEEIVRLQSMNQAKLDTIHDLSTRLETAKSEAIKEFTESISRLSFADEENGEGMVYLRDVYELVKKKKKITVNYESSKQRKEDGKNG